MRQLGVLFSFETTLVLFLFAGVYKEDLRFAWIPGDLTVNAFLLSFITGLYLLVRRGVVLRREGMMITGLGLLLVVWAFISYLWSPSLNYSLRKIALLGSLTLWPLASFAIVVASERRRLLRFFTVLFIFSMWIGLESAFALAMAALKGIRGFITTSLSTNYLGLGRVIGPGAVVLVSVYFGFLHRAWQKVLGALLILFYALLMLGIGSRGPFLAMFAACLLVVLISIRPARNIRVITARLLTVMLGLSLMLGIVFFYMSSGAELPRTINRLQKAQEEGFSGSTRFSGYSTTWMLLEESPLWGRGVGSWPVVTGRGDIRAYPHNIFLEVFFELGLVGLLLFTAMLVYPLTLLPGIRGLREDPLLLLALAQYLSAFINANLSGDLNDNKLLWASMGMMVIAALQRRSSAAALPSAAAQPSPAGGHRSPAACAPQSPS
ncbi:MAG: O-antigen ligase family protein [bacterium]